MKSKNLKISIMDALVSVGWTHKIQEKQSEQYLMADKWLRFFQIMSAGFTSTGAISLLMSTTIWAKIATALAGLISFIVSGILKSWDFQSMALINKRYANQQFIIREKLMKLLVDLTNATSKEEYTVINEQWDTINNERLSSASEAPYTSNQAVVRASYELNKRHDNARSEDYHLFISEDFLEELKNVKQ